MDYSVWCKRELMYTLDMLCSSAKCTEVQLSLEFVSSATNTL